jgi:hypothetical protein
MRLRWFEKGRPGEFVLLSKKGRPGESVVLLKLEYK